MQALKAPSPQPSPMDKWERRRKYARMHAAQAQYKILCRASNAEASSSADTKELAA
jgi:hypothetical protein